MDIEIRDKFVQDLRDFADYIEERGENLPLDEYDCQVTVRGFLYDDSTYDYETGKATITKTAKAKMKEAVRSIGKASKVWSDGYFDLRREFGSITLEFSIPRAQVCVRKVVGTEEVPERIIPATTREIVEWECDDPLLKASE